MKTEELRTLLATVHPAEGELPAWCAGLEIPELARCLGMLRARLDQIAVREAALVLVQRLETHRAHEAVGSITRPLFDQAIRAAARTQRKDEVRRWEALVDAAERARPGVPQLSAWLAALAAITGDDLEPTPPPLPDEGEEEEPGPPIVCDEDEGEKPAPPAASRDGEKPAPPVASGEGHASAPPPRQSPPPSDPGKKSASSAPRAGLNAPKPSGSKDERVRAMIESVKAQLRQPPARQARWGIDFGTAYSKVVFRDEGGAVTEGASTSHCVPSLVVVEKGGDRILFGVEAEKVRGDARTWNVCMSMKRFLVGKRIDVAGMPTNMTTERLTMLYIAWLIHGAHAKGTKENSPCDHLSHLSMPLAISGENPTLRDPFAILHQAPKLAYRDWLPRAFRLAQLLASMYRDGTWPQSVKELLLAVQHWERTTWDEIGRQFPTTSEPAAVVGDFAPSTLEEGLTMLVDCGAGTTDVSVFWRKGNHIYKVVEHSAVVGGDIIDEKIVQEVIRLHPILEPHQRSILAWAREAKPALLAEGKVDFDPEQVLELRGLGISRSVTIDKVKDGISQMTEGVKTVTLEALRAAEKAMLTAKPSGQQVWPTVRDIKQVWYLGGSSAVAGVPPAIDEALQTVGVTARATRLALPNQYLSWKPERYRLLACAVGASRASLEQPKALPSAGTFGPIGNSPFDKD